MWFRVSFRQDLNAKELLEVAPAFDIPCLDLYGKCLVLPRKVQISSPFEGIPG